MDNIRNFFAGARYLISNWLEEAWIDLLRGDTFTLCTAWIVITPLMFGAYFVSGADMFVFLAAGFLMAILTALPALLLWWLCLWCLERVVSVCATGKQLRKETAENKQEGL